MPLDGAAIFYDSIYIRVESEDYMKKVFKIGCFSLLGLFVIGVIGSFFVSDDDTGNSPSVRETVVDTPQLNEKSDFDKLVVRTDTSVHAVDLINEYEANEFAADAKYKGKIVAVRGKISNMHKTLGMHFLNLESVNFIMNVSCQMKKSQLPVLQTLSKDQDVLVIGEVTGSTAGLSVDMKDCAVISVADYRKHYE